MSLGNRTGIFVVMLAVAVFCAGGIAVIGATSDTEAAGETYEIRYVVGEQTYSYTGSKASVTLKSIEDLGIALEDGKQMDGWLYHGTAIIVAVGSTVVLSADAPTVFDAQISDIEYTVHFMDGETVVSTVDNYTYGQDLVVPENPTKTGFTFAGWDPEVAETVTADATYTAQWKTIYSVSWIVEGVTVSTGTTEKVTTMKMLTDPVKESFRFLGWFDADGVKYSTAYEFVGNTVFTADFAAEVYTVTFVYGESDTVFLTETVQHGDKAIRPMGLPEGYSGWDFDFETPVTEDLTITATESEPGAPAFWNTALGQCAIIIAVFLVGLFAWAVYKGKIEIPKIGVVKKE